MPNPGSSQKLTILLMGPLPPPYGGARILFHQLVKRLTGQDMVDLQVLPIWHPEASSLQKALSVLRLGVRMLASARQADVIAAFLSDSGTLAFAPIVHGIARLHGKPWLLREFGGSFDLTYARLSGWRQSLVRRTVLSADLSMFETRYLVSHFRSVVSDDRVAWHSNFRDLEELERSHRSECRRFVFLGNVKPSKGIQEIMEATATIDRDIEVDVFGRLQQGITERTFDNAQNVEYKGLLRPDEIIPTLSRYDALLLPTYYEGEGYPGVILEAYSVGIPVIATRWRAIPEIVDEDTGLLIEPRDSRGLAQAMTKLIDDGELYQRLCDGAWAKRQDFSLSYWADQFVDACARVAKKEHDVTPR